jgi:hypothetical protein
MTNTMNKIENLKEAALCLRGNGLENTEAFIMIAERIAYLYSFDDDDSKANFWMNKIREAKNKMAEAIKRQ